MHNPLDSFVIDLLVFCNFFVDTSYTIFTLISFENVFNLPKKFNIAFGNVNVNEKVYHLAAKKFTSFDYEKLYHVIAKKFTTSGMLCSP